MVARRKKTTQALTELLPVFDDAVPVFRGIEVGERESAGNTEKRGKDALRYTLVL